MELIYSGIDPVLIAALLKKGAGVSQEEIEKAVEKYLQENPIGTLDVAEHVIVFSAEENE